MPITLPLVDGVRRQLAVEVAHVLIGDNEPARERRSLPVEDDPGLFGPDSVTWRLHEDSCLIAGGLRALMLQTMHPLAMAGIAQHSRYRTDPLGRLATTASYVGTAVYGTTAEVGDAVAAVKRAHERVVGTAADGRPYAANDPELLAWVHHTLVDSFLRAHQRWGARPLSVDEADRYVAEQARLADLFGAAAPARSMAELRASFEAIRPQLRATPEARSAIRFLLAPPLPLTMRPAYAAVATAAVSLLPPWVRRELWLPLPPGVEPLIVRPATWAMFRSLDWVLAAHPAGS